MAWNRATLRCGASLCSPWNPLAAMSERAARISSSSRVPALARQGQVMDRSRHGIWNMAQAGARPRERDVDALGDTLGLDRRWLSDAIARPTPCGVLIDDVERRQAEEGIWTLDVVEITQAIADLRRRLACPHYHRTRESS